VFLGEPQDLADVARELRAKEDEGWDAQYRGDGPRALMPGGETLGLVEDIPTVQDLVDRVVREAEQIIESLPQRFLRD
jgi:enoyl-[acyl-carrier protein] reductase II